MSNRSALRLNFARKMMLVTAGLTALAAPLVVGISNAPASGLNRRRRGPVGAAAPAFEVASIKLNPDCVIGMDAVANRLSVSTYRAFRFVVFCGWRTALRSAQFSLRAVLRSWVDRTGSIPIGTLFPQRPRAPPLRPRWWSNAPGAPRREVQSESPQGVQRCPVYELTVAKNSPKLQPQRTEAALLWT